MTHVHVYNIESPYIRKESDLQASVWDDVDGEPTEVGIEGKLVLNTSLRKSTSIRNKYRLSYLPGQMDILFKKYFIGDGSKHIYQVGDFMKKHYDSRLPDLVKKYHYAPPEGTQEVSYPHIMTLLLIKNSGYTGGDLYVEDKQVVSYDHEKYLKGAGQYIAVLFSLNASHEVKPVTSGSRHVFAFPIYGEYNPMERIKQFKTSTSTDIREYVVQKLTEELEILITNSSTPEQKDKSDKSDTPDVEDKDSVEDVVYKDGVEYKIYKPKPDTPEERRAKLQGCVAALNDSVANGMIVSYRESLGDWAPHGIDHHYDSGTTDSIIVRSVVTYTLDDKEVTEYVYDKFSVPSGAKNVVVSIASKPCRILEGLIEYIKNMKELYLDPRRDWYTTSRNSYDDKKTAIDENPFVVLLKGRYFHDSTVADLTPEDKITYDVIKATGRTVEFLPTAIWQKHEKSLTCVMYVDGQFVKTVPASTYIDGICVEFDDQGGYDPSYTLVYGMLAVV